MFKYYDKLVRDKIPEIIRKEKVEFDSVELGGSGPLYAHLLEEKLQEEVGEFLSYKSEGKVPDVHELADILEVVFALAQAHGFTEDDLVCARESKCIRKGGFDKGVYLSYIDRGDKSSG